ncbi:hypothetical protein ASE07_12275 [Noviherbaspirillum sp. Root189]|nr:hypothetical protein ASE07_12275 [Noviherbaspirillum sp. Root189]
MLAVTVLFHEWVLGLLALTVFYWLVVIVFAVGSAFMGRLGRDLSHWWDALHGYPKAKARAARFSKMMDHLNLQDKNKEL